jgi:hypothetical protein
MKRLIPVALAALTLTACATATPYEPAGKDTYGTGYSEQRVEPDRWQVNFSGNSSTSRQTVESYMLYRAAELTVQNGYDWFQTVDRSTQTHTSFVGTPGPYGPYGPYWAPSWRYYRHGGWGPWGPGYDLEEVQRYQASTEIIMHHGPKPADNPRAFDARQVMANLGPTVVRPAPSK